MEIKILFECYADNEDVVDDVCNNFFENYGYYGDFEEDDYSYKNERLHVVWVANVEEDELSEEDINNIIRMAHHAEGIYENTNAEYSHCEVCIDGTWYGKLNVR